MLNHAKTRMSMMQLVFVAEEAGLNFTWSALKSLRVWLNSRLIILRSTVTNWPARVVVGSSFSKGAAWWLQTNTLLIAWYWFNPILRSTKF